MAKTRSFCVAVEGATTDGRVIERSWIEEMAATYNPVTYGARINMEHIRGYSPDAPFNAYGDVLALETRNVEVELGGKKETKLGLFATLDVTDELIALNTKRQKLYTSIEVNPNMAGTGKAYLMGLAVTDSPASLGTEMLAFAAKATVNPFAARKQGAENLFTVAVPLTLELEAPAADPVEGPLEKFAKLIVDKFTPKPAEPEKPANPVIDPKGTPDFTAMFSGLTTALTEQLKADREATNAAVVGLRGEFTALQTKIESTPSKNHSHRPEATGGDQRVLTDC